MDTKSHRSVSNVATTCVCRVLLKPLMMYFTRSFTLFKTMCCVLYCPFASNWSDYNATCNVYFSPNMLTSAQLQPRKDKNTCFQTYAHTHCSAMTEKVVKNSKSNHFPSSTHLPCLTRQTHNNHYQQVPPSTK